MHNTRWDCCIILVKVLKKTLQRPPDGSAEQRTKAWLTRSTSWAGQYIWVNTLKKKSPRPLNGLVWVSVLMTPMVQSGSAKQQCRDMLMRNTRWECVMRMAMVLQKMRIRRLNGTAKPPNRGKLPPDHPYQWLCFDNGDGPVKMYEKAVTVGTIFQKRGHKIAFHVFDGVTWTRNVFGMDTGTYERSRVLSFDELKAEAVKNGIGVQESSTVASADIRVRTMDELMALKPKDFVLYPLLKEGFYCLIYGGSGVAKTWFTLYIAIALTQGKAPFKGWKFNGNPLNVLYVAGEMKPEEYGDRLRKLLSEQKTNARFRLVREDLDLTTPEDQERIIKAVNEHKSQVVVLDNLSTLASNGHTEGQFEKVLALIRKIQADGIIVILVHHENREGSFKGSGKIELVADQSLHLFPAGNGDKIELLVRAEKIRMTSRAEQTSFHTEFDPNQPTEVWPTRSLKKEERRRLDEDDPLGEVEMNVGKKRNDKRLAWQYLSDDERAVAVICDMLSGCHDDVIAANLAVREIAITEFKQQSGITEKALKLYIPRAREYAEKNLGKKITPEDLAPEIWKLLKDKGNGSNKDGTDRI